MFQVDVSTLDRRTSFEIAPLVCKALNKLRQLYLCKKALATMCIEQACTQPVRYCYERRQHTTRKMGPKTTGLGPNLVQATLFHQCGQELAIPFILS